MNKVCITPLLVAVILSTIVLGACGLPVPDPTASPEPTALVQKTAPPASTSTWTPSPEPENTSAPSPTARPSNTVRPSATSAPTATPTPEPPTATPTPEPPAIRVEPTLTPGPGDERARVAELPLGQPGHYVNVTFGYWVQVWLVFLD